MNNDKDKDILYINHSAELLAWLLVILFFVVVFTICKIHKEKFEDSYDIFMPDVDGLIVGSPVKMMGIEVGHIVKIQPIDDEVHVKFLITTKDIKIPKGTQATVEFSGMAGSKSLELYLPDENSYVDDTVPMLTVTPPKRLHDAFGLLNDMFKRIGDMITKTSQFGHQLKKLDLPQSNNEDITNFIKFANEALDEANDKAENLERRLDDAK